MHPDADPAAAGPTDRGPSLPGGAPGESGIMPGVFAGSVPGIIALATLVVYGAALRYPWLAWDDRLNVTENPGLQPVTWRSLAGFWLAAYERLYIPVAYTFFAAETLASRAIHGVDAWPPDPRLFHASSLLLHAAAGLLVFRLLARTGVRSTTARLAGALVFLLHPLQVESVAWISEQRGLLSATLSLAALEFAAGPGALAAGERRGLAALGCYALAVLSKPQVIALPLAVLALDDRVGREPWRATARRYLPWGAVALAILAATMAAQPASGLADRPPFWLRPVVAGDALAHYAAAVAAPVGLAIDHGRMPRVVLDDPRSFLQAAAAGAGLAAVALVPLFRRARLATALWVIPLLPVLGFMPFVFQGISTVADRYAYLSLLGPAVAVGHAADAAGRTRAARRFVIAAGLLVCAILAARQVTTWRDSTTLFTRALEVNPASFIARRGLAGELARQGRHDEALAQLDGAIGLEARFAVPELSRYPRALSLHRLGRTAEAAPEYRRALDVEQDNPRLRNDYGILLAQTGHVADAAKQFRAAIRLEPGFAEALANLRSAEAILARPKAAERE